MREAGQVAQDTATTPLLELRDVSVAFKSRGVDLMAVDRVSLTIAAGEVMALVGESGCGKSVTSLAIMGLLPRLSARVASGVIQLSREDGTQLDLARISERRMREIRGDKIAMIFQEPMTCLNPLETIGNQVAEVLVTHRDIDWPAGRRAAAELLARVSLSDPQKKLQAFPHELSGGMRQRVMIAMALACRPRLLIADEPTTALDVTVQAQILDLISALRRDFGMAVLFITHNLGVVAEIADRVSVMYAGQIVESGTVRNVLRHPRHPYTRSLLDSVPRVDRRGGKLPTIAGIVPDLRHIPGGCRFHPRCSFAQPGNCDVTAPAAETTLDGGTVRCLRWREFGLT